MYNKVVVHSGYNIISITIILILALMFSTNGDAEPEKTIVIIGDSLSAAHGIPLETSWPQLLQKKLHEEKLPYKIINTSISGDTSYTAFNRSKKILPQIKPDICIIAIGANDGLQGLSLKQLKSNLKSIVGLCKQYSDKILLIEMKVPLNYGLSFVNRFADVYHQVAKEEEVKLLPFFVEPFADNLSLFLPDQFHPTEQAQAILADAVWSGLVDFVK